MRSLEPARERFERPYVLDARALAAAAPAPAADDDAIVLGELKVTRVFPSGLSATFNQLVVKVVNAARRGGVPPPRHRLDAGPAGGAGRARRAIVKPDGTSVETHDESERSASEPWYRLYYDTRARTLSFPALAPGDVLEVAWRIEDTAGENLLSDYFGDLTFLDDADPEARASSTSLLVPEARPIYSNAPDGVAPRDAQAPGRRSSSTASSRGTCARIAARARDAGLERGRPLRPRLDLRELGRRWRASTGGS